MKPELPERISFLPDIPAVKIHMAGGRTNQAVKMLHQRGFPASRMADDTDKLPFRDLQGNIL